MLGAVQEGSRWLRLDRIRFVGLLEGSLGSPVVPFTFFFLVLGSLIK